MRQANRQPEESIELTSEIDEAIAKQFPNSRQTLQQHREHDEAKYRLLRDVLWYEVKVLKS